MKYLIIFTTSNENQLRLATAIKCLGDFCEVTPNSYVVISNENAGVLTERLQVLLGPMDSLAVFSISAPWASYCNPIVEDFLLSELGQNEDWTPHDWNEETQSRT